MPALLPSELPVRARARHHWVVLLRPPHKWGWIGLAAGVVLSIAFPNPVAWAFVLLLAGLGYLRVRTWRAERILLTGKRIIRVQGIPETTTSEASLRIDRISGARLIETVPGKLLGYGTIELEAPGDHPDVRKLVKIADPQAFFLLLRDVIFGETRVPDPDDRPGEYVTEPLPRVRRAPTEQYEPPMWRGRRR